MKRSPSATVLAVCLVAFFVVAGTASTSKPSALDENESNAVGAIHTLNTAFFTYKATYEIGFPHSLGVLGAPVSGEQPNPWGTGLVTAELARGMWKGYKFTYRPGPEDGEGHINTYTLSVRPLEQSETGLRSFFTDETGKIRGAEEDRPATASDLPVQ